MRDEFGDRMKGHEAVETERRLDPSLPVYARLDGRAFSRFTRGMARPYDPLLMDAMARVTEGLVADTHAAIGYTQSDEISLVWLPVAPPAELMFGGRIQKLCSVLASSAAAKLALLIAGWEPFASRAPAFDARVMSLPSLGEAENMLLWRVRDAQRNAVLGAGQARFSHRQMNGKDQNAVRAMLAEVGADFDESFPAAYRFGTFVRRTAVERMLTDAELARIPERHRPSGPVMRTAFERWSNDQVAGLLRSDATAA